MASDKESQKRRRRNNKGVPKLKDYFFLIDGNYSNQPYAFCTHYRGFLTKNQSIRHSCEERNCKNLKSLEWAMKKYDK